MDSTCVIDCFTHKILDFRPWQFNLFKIDEKFDLSENKLRKYTQWVKNN